MPDTSIDLVDRFLDGDDSAATEIFQRYIDRLTRLARARLSLKLARRVDADDVVLSAWRSFFSGAKEGRLRIERSGDLWALLTRMTLFKLYRAGRRHRAGRRSLHREESPAAILQLADDSPGPDEVVAFNDELTSLLEKLDSQPRRILELALQGYQQREIAELTGKSERTVRRSLARIREQIGAEMPDLKVRFESRRTSAAAEHPPSPHSKPDFQPFPDRPGDSQFRDDEFVIRRYLGGGGFGRVYYSERKSDGAAFAVKFLRKHFLQRPDVIERFLNEAAILHRLQHPAIVSLAGTGLTAAGHPFLVMPFVDSQNLDQRRTDRTLSISEVVRITTNVAGILQAAHAAGVIHCDLKPENLLIDSSGQLYLTDFGLARTEHESDHQSFRLAGTPAYMAPEQIDPAFGRIGPWTDLYALGMILYFLLTGTTAFAASTPAETLSEIIRPRNAGRISSALPAQVPQKLRDICEWCLARRPDERPQSAEHFLQRLPCRNLE